MTAQQLKNSILQMAVQGKLVPQNPDDEPASVLLERIKAEKQELIKQGKIKKEKPLSPISDDEIPFEIPESWCWTKVGELFSNMSGLSYKKDSLSIQSETMIRVLRGGNILECSYQLKSDDVFISNEFVKNNLYLKKNYMITPSVTSMEHIGKIALIEKDFEDIVVGGFVLMLIPYFNIDILSKYLLFCFSSKYHRDICRSITHKSGQAFYNLSREKLMDIYVPLPPLSEQKRIVEKIEELLPFIEQYEKAETQLNTLNTSFPDMLKKSILQYAVQGKLVSQNADDEPASVLLERIRTEKQELIKQGKIKKEKPLSPISDDEIPFDIPENWCWCRLGQILEIARGGSPRPIKQFLTEDENGINWIKIGDSDKGGKYINSTKEKIIPEGMSKSRFVHKGDFLLTNSMSFGRPYILNVDGCIHDGWLVLSEYTSIYDKDFLYYLLSSRFAYYQFCDVVSGAVVKNLNSDKVAEAIFPIPPLAEQKRIVEKIEELMPIIDGINK